MALQITDRCQVGLNGLKYTTPGGVRPQRLPRTPSKTITGVPEYANEQILSNWIIRDLRGGIGVLNMDESIDADRCMWTNCIIDYPGHIVLPRLATEVTPSVTLPTITDGGLELWDDATNLTNWTKTGAGDPLNRQAVTVIEGTFSAGLRTNAATIYQDAANWVSAFQETTIIVTAQLYTAQGTDIRVGINDGVDTTYSSYHTGGGGWETLLVQKKLGAAADKIRVIIDYAAATGAEAFADDIQFHVTSGGTTFLFENFNSNLYMAVGTVLYKLDTSSGSAWLFVASFQASITALIRGPNSMLYIYLGDSDEYLYMNTSEVFVETDVNDANLGVMWDDKLWKLDTDGNYWSAATPNAASPTWTAEGSITDIGGDVENLEVGHDTNGDDVVYAGTHSIMKVYDDANSKWIDTSLRLPDHPKGGKGLVYWRDAMHISSGLDVRKYTVGSVATISEIGLNRDDGLLVEHNGEIVKLIGEGENDMFALVDSSITSGNSKSGVYAYNERAWRCWWIDTANNGAMNDGIVSSAYEYRLYWDVGAKVYYIDLHRGLRNPKQLSGTQKYLTPGVFLSPSFDADTAVFDKLAKALNTFCKDVSTTLTVAVKYRLNQDNIDLDTGWTTMDTLNTTAESDKNEEIFGSNLGTVFQSIQFRLDLTRVSGANTTTPDVQNLVLSYMKLLDSIWSWGFRIILDDLHGTTARQKEENLKTVIEAQTFVKFIYREDDTTETEYVKVFNTFGETETGRNYEGHYDLTVIAL